MSDHQTPEMDDQDTSKPDHDTEAASMNISNIKWSSNEGWSDVPLMNGRVKKRIVREGHGEEAGLGAILSIHAKGYYFRDDGTMTENPFWHTREHHNKEPVLFYSFCGQAAPGFEAGCITMKMAEVAQFKIESDVGYGRYGHEMFGVPANVNLLFEVELMDHHPE